MAASSKYNRYLLFHSLNLCNDSNVNSCNGSDNCGWRDADMDSVPSSEFQSQWRINILVDQLLSLCSSGRQSFVVGTERRGLPLYLVLCLLGAQLDRSGLFSYLKTPYQLQKLWDRRLWNSGTKLRDTCFNVGSHHVSTLGSESDTVSCSTSARWPWSNCSHDKTDLAGHWTGCDALIIVCHTKN
jgi:hypothetical protein